MKAVLFDFFGVIADVRMALVGEPGQGTHRLVIHEPVVAAAIRLRSAGVRTALVTNNDRAAFEASGPRLPFEEWFDVVVFSSDAGFAKPDHRIFQYALNALGIEAREAFFFDDVPRNVDAAEALGITGHVVTNPASVPVVVDELLAQRN